MGDAQGHVGPLEPHLGTLLYQPRLSQQGSWGEGDWATGSFLYLRTSIIRPDGGPAHLPYLPARKGAQEERWEARDTGPRGPRGRQGAPRAHSGPAQVCPHPCC